MQEKNNIKDPIKENMEQHAVRLIKEAKRLIQAGWCILPVLLIRGQDGKKLPIFNFKYSQMNPEDYCYDFFIDRVKSLVGKYGRFTGLAVLVRHTPGLVVVDADTPAAVNMIYLASPKVTTKLKSLTPSGGSHYYWLCDTPLPHVQCSNAGIDVMEVDFLPPSKIEELDGTYTGYKWVSAPKNGIPKLPKALESYLRALKPVKFTPNNPEKPFVATDSYINKLITQPPTGPRQWHLLKLAGALKSQGKKEEDTAVVLKDLCESNNWGDKIKKIPGIVKYVYSHQ